MLLNTRARLATLAAMLSLLVITFQATAATYHVAQDDSGDFEYVYDAVDAAASGDTVTIGPGVYPNVREWVAPGGLVEVIAVVDVDELTIIGAGRDLVTLGPAVPAPNVEFGPDGIVCTVDGNVRVEGVTIRNVNNGVAGNDRWATVQNCRFTGCDIGFKGFTSERVRAESCEFVDNDDGMVSFVVRGAFETVVEDCLFEGNSVGLDIQTEGGVVSDCHFWGNFVGAQVSFGGQSVVRDSIFEESGNFDLALAGARVELTESYFGIGVPVNIQVQGLLTGSGNVLMGGTFATMKVSSRAAIDFTDNHILNNGGRTILLNPADFPVGPHNFEDNYWGTNDVAQIEEWIFDQNDEQFDGLGLVDFMPFAGNPVSTDESSFGAFKAQFGN